MGLWWIKWRLSAGADVHALVPPEEQSSPSKTSSGTKDTDSANGSRSAPSGELRSASILSIVDFSALRRAYLLD